MKWGKELFSDVELNTDEEPVVFKAQLFALTGVQPNRQKVMIKGAAIKDDSWENVANKMKNGATLLLMGSKEEDIPKEVTPAERTQFLEDMDESQIQSALKLPAGLTNLGNTCYLNATVQCFKTVPELKKALMSFQGKIFHGHFEVVLKAATVLLSLHHFLLPYKNVLEKARQI